MQVVLTLKYLKIDALFLLDIISTFRTLCTDLEVGIADSINSLVRIILGGTKTTIFNYELIGSLDFASFATIIVFVTVDQILLRQSD